MTVAPDLARRVTAELEFARRRPVARAMVRARS